MKSESAQSLWPLTLDDDECGEFDAHGLRERLECVCGAQFDEVYRHDPDAVRVVEGGEDG